MLNTPIHKTVIVLIILLSLFEGAFAEDRAQISMYCSIPEVPGLNAPPLADITMVSQPGISPKNDYLISEEIRNQTFSTMEQITQKQIILADGTSSSLITQTVYVR